METLRGAGQETGGATRPISIELVIDCVVFMAGTESSDRSVPAPCAMPCVTGPPQRLCQYRSQTQRNAV